MKKIKVSDNKYFKKVCVLKNCSSAPFTLPHVLFCFIGYVIALIVLRNTHLWHYLVPFLLIDTNIVLVL